jgi:hypothetical protein
MGDAAEIATLIVELGYSPTEQFVRDRLTQLSSSAMDMVFVAEYAGEIGGFLSFHILLLFHVEGNLGRITALAVKILGSDGAESARN